MSRNSDVWTSANRVTFVRIVLIPVFVAILIAPWPQYFPEWTHMQTLKPWLAAGVFIAISLTDMLDGYLARSRGEVTDFGKFLDPLADKLLVTAALLSLIELDVIPSWVALVIISREFIVSGVRMVAASKGEVIAASIYGKVKTVFQMAAIVLFIVKDSHVITDFNALWHDWLYLFSWAVMAIAVVFTVVSMLDYLYHARHVLGFSYPVEAGSGADREAGSVVAGASGSGAAPSDEKPVWGEKTSLLAQNVLDHARERGFLVATAESCTGGLISAALTAIPGSSDVVAGGIVSYSNDVKKSVLDVSEDTLGSVGAVSCETACEMAEGAIRRTGADVAVSVTGIAGPGGAVPGKPVGTVWVGVADANGSHAFECHFDGDRDQVRQQTVEKSLRLLDDAILEKSGL